MNLDEYITKLEKGAFSFQELQKIANSYLISTIFRLYGSYGEAKKTKFYDNDSLKWILDSLERALKLAGCEQAAFWLKIDINNSFSQFWIHFEEFNQDNLVKKSKKVKAIRRANLKLS